MANLDAPFGFEPVSMLDGSKIPTREFLATSLSAAIFRGDLVSAINAGDVEPSTADDGVIVLGSVVDIKDVNGNSAGHPNGAISTKHLAIGDSGIVTVALAVPNAVFKVQTSGTVAATAVFASSDHVATVGNTVTARSKQELNSNLSGEQLKIIDKVDEPGNAWGLNVNLLVVFGESYWFSSPNGV